MRVKDENIVLMVMAGGYDDNRNRICKSRVDLGRLCTCR